jgi:hypothetical protein
MLLLSFRVAFPFLTIFSLSHFGHFIFHYPLCLFIIPISLYLTIAQHTIERIFGAFDRLEIEHSAILLPLDLKPLVNIEKAQHVFIGYLLLDAWIGNSDRHHENWGCIELDKKLYLAPTYDHASSLCRNESDRKREARLWTKDKGYSVEVYTDKCQPYLYTNTGNRQRIKTFTAFCEAAKLYLRAACVWLDILKNVSQDYPLSLLNQIP